MERYLREYLLGPGPRLMKKKLPGRGLTKVEKHWYNRRHHSIDDVDMYIISRTRKSTCLVDRANQRTFWPYAYTFTHCHWIFNGSFPVVRSKWDNTSLKWNPYSSIAGRRRLTKGLLSEKCVFRQFRRCAKIYMRSEVHRHVVTRRMTVLRILGYRLDNQGTVIWISSD